MVSLKKSKNIVKNYTDVYVDNINNISNIVKNIIIYNKPYSIYYDSITVYNKNINIAIELIKTENINLISVSGETILSNKPYLITIKVEYPKYAYKKNINYIIAELKDSLRHEVQHWIQKMDKTFTISELSMNFEKNRFNYYLMKHEIEAHIYGFIYNSKENNRSLYDILSDILKHWRCLTPYQKDIIKREYDIYFKNFQNL